MHRYCMGVPTHCVKPYGVSLIIRSALTVYMYMHTCQAWEGGKSRYVCSKGHIPYQNICQKLNKINVIIIIMIRLIMSVVLSIND